MHLEQKLNVPVSVVNATGGKGVTGHNRGLTARSDGYTLTMMTFELSTMHWIGLTDLDFNSCLPIASLNEDYAAIFIRKKATWATLQDLVDEIKSRPGELSASGTAAGGAWHLALAGWLIDSGLEADAVTWIPSPGANPSLQELMSGGVDMVCCSLPEARSLLEAEEVRALGVMGPKRAKGFEQVATFAEQGSSWKLGGWRGMGVPLNTPKPIVDKLCQTIQEITAETGEGSFARFMADQKFDLTVRESKDFEEFLSDADEKLGKLLQSEAMRSVTEDRFNPMSFPYILLGLLGLTALAIGVTNRRRSSETDEATGERDSTSSASIRGLVGFAIVLLSIAAYCCFAEQVGFVLLAGSLVLLLMLWLGTKPIPAVVVACIFVPILYSAFAFLLRVPLPTGWLG